MKLDLPAFRDALVSDVEAGQTFSWLGAQNHEQFLSWIKAATCESECNHRIQAAVDMLAGREVVRRN